MHSFREEHHAVDVCDTVTAPVQELLPLSVCRSLCLARVEAAVVVPVSSLQVERAVATCVRDMLETACSADLTLRSDDAAATASSTGAPERLTLTCVDAPPPALDAETTSSSETVLSPVSAFFSRMRVMDDGVTQEFHVQKVV